ncbi:MAG: hypothetical protein UY49_C0010G0006 [Microgenomates group bacterium GW2011_GWC1_49_7]|nr:MAG: hypothetical protein UY49_C0010G0006 [Microgenomates group bacterium GW2011_GWC1_49_7]
MPENQENSKDRAPRSELRTIEAYDIESYFRSHWDQIEVEILPRGEMKTVEPGWYGSGEAYEARVDFGDLLTTPIAGTNLPARALTEWLAARGFLFERGNEWLNWQQAAEILASDASTIDGVPVFRAWRRDGGVPVEIEYYNGSRPKKMQQLTYLGNQPSLTYDQKVAFSTIAGDLAAPFISKGTTKVATHLELEPGYRRTARKDDCLAAASTFVADKLISHQIDLREKRDEQTFWTDDVVVATSQAVVISTLLSERLGVPLLIRAGAPSFGLAGTPEDLNYMYNTQPEMLQYGLFTSGDFGENMVKSQEAPGEPARILYGHGSPLRETRFFLRGGGPIMDLMFRSLDGRNKRHQGVISICTAKRIHKGFNQWSVVETGVHPTPEDDYNPRYRIPKGAVLRLGKLEDSPIVIFEAGDYGKLVGTEDDFRVLKVIVDGQLRTLYEPLPAKD